MAQQVEYDAKVDPTLSAHEELGELIETLHESGTLRVLNGFFGRIAEVSEVAMEELASPKGQHAIANAALLLMAFAKIDPHELRTLLQEMEQGVGDARETLQAEPPSTLELAKLLRDPQTRRGLHAGLTIVRALGGR